jgi:hypothetical protein
MSGTVSLIFSANAESASNDENLPLMKTYPETQWRVSGTPFTFEVSAIGELKEV